jgi:hypothetical protein
MYGDWYDTYRLVALSLSLKIERGYFEKLVI